MHISAAPVDSTRAMQSALGFFSALTHTPQEQLLSDGVSIAYRAYADETAGGTGNTVCFYVVNVGRKGFVMLSGDDRFKPILGYSNESSFSTKNMPENLRSWLGARRKEISSALGSGTLFPSPEIIQQWNHLSEIGATVSVMVQPLLQTTWDQNSYYNQFCPADPNGPNGHAYAGCVAAAMAQIIRYWQWPWSGFDSHSYTCAYGTQSVDFSTADYNYSNMPNYIYGGSSSTQIDAVATLIYHCGVSVDMDYGPDGSGASSFDVMSALVDYFAYPSGMSYQSKSYYSATEWDNLLRYELNNGRPILYSGQGTGGHSFVCDGYDNNGTYHFNWGWSGYFNGYYALNALTPSSGSYSSGYNFTDDQEALIGISAAGAFLRCSQNSLNVSAPIGGSSEVNAVDVRGHSLNGNITVTAGDGFVVGTDGNTFSNSVSLPAQGGRLYVRYTPTLSAPGSQNANVILTSGTVQDTLLCYGTAFEEFCLPPQNLTGTHTGTQVQLSWTEPVSYGSGPEAVTLSWDSTVAGGNFGFGQNMTVCMMQRFDVNDVAPYHQYLLKSISFIPASQGTSFRLVVYKGGNYLNGCHPGTQIVNQEVPAASLVRGTWNTVPLNSPVLVDASEELWFGFMVYTTGNSGYVIPVSTGSYVPDKGSVCGVCGGYNDGTGYFSWNPVNLEFNFPIKGRLERISADVVRYDVYRNASQIGSAVSTSYIDGSPLFHDCEYTVSAVWDNGCSQGVGVTVEAPEAPQVSYGDTAAVACGTFDWYEHTGITLSGAYTHTFVGGASSGGDSVVTLHLTIHNPTHTATTITACESFTWNGITYTESGEYTQTFTGTNWCDSVVTLHLTVARSTDTTFTTTVVENDLPYHINDTISFTDEGVYTVVIPNAAGCDSTIHLALFVSNNVAAYAYDAICETELPFIWNDVVFRSAVDSTATVTLTTVSGADSVLTMHLHVDTVVRVYAAASVCFGDTYDSLGFPAVITAATLLTDTVPSVLSGCDSITTVSVTMLAPTASTVTVDTCDSFTWIDGITYYESTNTPTITLTNAVGCDSVVTLHLTIRHGTYTSVTGTACESFEWYDTIYTESGDYTQTFTATSGCDSVVTLHLTIYQSKTVAMDSVVCASELPFTWNGVTFTEAGTQTVALVSAEGCDSVVTMHLSVVNCGPVIDDKSCPAIPTVTDIDGNVYNTVQIGGQCWMRENLRTTRYADGNNIPQGNNYLQRSPRWYYSDNDPSNKDRYGLLYNWYAVMHNASSSDATPSGVQGICPTGWHLPSNSEWAILMDYVRSKSEYVCGSDNRIAKALADTAGWTTSTYGCAVGNNLGNNNATGFSAIPVGYCLRANYTNGGGSDAYFWSSSERGNAQSFHLQNSGGMAYRSENLKDFGYSVRCLRNEGGTSMLAVVITDSVTSITSNTAVCGGNVLSDGSANLIARGVCWSTNHNPTIEDNHSVDGNETGSFNSSITGLSSNFIYYVRAYATNQYGTVYGDEVTFFVPTNPNGDVLSCPNSPILTDFDGNVYNTVQIGGQCWMRENLRTTKYADGTDINQYDSWRYPIGDSSYKQTYGLLYSWHAMMRHALPNDATPSGVQGICPDGWHVPSDAEWKQLYDFVSSQSENVCGSYFGEYYIAKTLAATCGWAVGLSSCTVGYEPNSNNATGFGALPAGACEYEEYSGLGTEAHFWSSTARRVSYPISYRLYFYSWSVDRSWAYEYYNHYSVRCLQDDVESPMLPTVTTDSITSILFNSATCGGNIVYEGSANVTACGVCWSTRHNPTLDDYYTTDGVGVGVEHYTSNLIGIASNQTFYVRAYATNPYGTVYGNEISFTTPINPAGDNLSCSGSPTITDIDGNNYNTVQIGDQCWMRENLRTTRYSNGSTIMQSDGAGYYDDYYTVPYWSYPNNDSSYKQSYGLLYNWSATMSCNSYSVTNLDGAQGVCPIGWHIPSDAEWTQLADYMSNQSEYICENNSTYIAKALAATSGWDMDIYHDNCAVGNNQSNNNASGFGAIPAGIAYYYGIDKDHFGMLASFWSSTEQGDIYAYYRYMDFVNRRLIRSNQLKEYCGSVRCLRDSLTCIDTVPPVFQGTLPDGHVCPSGARYYVPDFTTYFTEETVSDNSYPFTLLTVAQSPVAGTEIDADTEVTVSLTDPCGNVRLYPVEVVRLYLSGVMIDSVVCESGQGVFWNGKTLEGTGTYYDTLTNAMGCDSIVVMNLYVLPTTYGDTIAMTCESFDWYGETFTSSGEYTHTYTNSNGCDSVVTLHLTVNYADTVYWYETACNSYTWNGITYYESGTYVQYFSNVNYCDSIVTLHLTVIYPDTVMVSTTVCESFDWYGETFTSSGEYTHTYTNSNGCDSVVTLHLTVNYADTVYWYETACNSYTWNGITYNESGTYVQYFSNVNYCDSIVTLHLTVLYPDTVMENATVCANELPFTWNGMTFTEAGTLTTTLTNAAGCDSVVVMHLTVADSQPLATPQIAIDNAAICNGGQVTLTVSNPDNNAVYTWFRNGAVIPGAVNATIIENPTTTASEPINYVYTVKAETLASGCASSSQISQNAVVTVIPAPVVSVSVDGYTTLCEGGSTSLNANVTPANGNYSYQWYKDNVLIGSAVSDHYVVSEAVRETAYSYSVVVSGFPGCTVAAQAPAITFVPDPYITITASNNVSCVGGSATLTAEVTCDVANANFTYYWYRYGTNDPGNPLSSSELIGTSAELTIPGSEPVGNYAYWMIAAADAFGCRSTSNIVNYAVVLDPAVTIAVANGYPQTVCSGGESMIKANVMGGFGEISYQWYKNGNLLVGETNQTLALNNLVSGMNHLYAVEVSQTGAGCSTSASAALNTLVTVKPGYSVWINGYGSVYEGEELVLTATVNNVIAGDALAYQWYKVTNGVASAVYGATSSTCIVSGLIPGNSYEYYVRVTSIISGCSCVSASVPVTVLPLPADSPTVITTALSDITTSSVSCGGYVISDGGSPVTAYGFCWSTSSDPTINDSHTINGSGTGYFESLITGLLPSTSYYVRAYATNSAGTAYGETRSFTTLCNSSNTIFTVNSCDNYSWHGTTYSQSGTYMYNYTNADGCPSTDTLRLQVHHSTNSVLDVAVLENDLPYYFNGHPYFATGIYIDTLLTVNGCDSIVALHLTVFNNVIAVCNDTICESELPFVWNGNIFTETSTKTAVFAASTDADSLVVMNLNVLPSSYGDTIAVACDSFEWYGETFTNSGEYTHTFTNAVGCDSVVTLHLTLKHSETVEYTEMVCDSYIWNGTTYTQSGDYVQTFTNTEGCDSVVTLHLTVNHSDTIEFSATACDSYNWNGVTYSQSGDYTTYMTNASGCNSVLVLHLTVNHSDTTDLYAAACDSYFWNGTTYHASGDYVHIFTNTAGCDSVVTLHLTLKHSETMGYTEMACDSYIWNGTTYTQSGDYVQTFTNTEGCDSVVTLHLTINHSVSELVEATVCDSYTWNGEVYSESGAYTQTLTNVNGCDSVVTLHLTVNHSCSTNLQATACDSYTWNDVTYYESGDYPVYLTNALGCDSIVTLHLTINHSDTIEFSAAACNSYNWNGVTYTESGDYVTNMTNAAGCNLVLVLHLTVNHSDTTDLYVTACDAYTWNGETYNLSGNYSHHSVNAAGCDSIITLHLTVNHPDVVDLYETACDSYTWNGATYTESGDYTNYLTNVDGCDSIVTLHLTVNSSEATELHVTACDSYTWNGMTYTESGSYSINLTNATGCDSLVTLHLTIHYSDTIDFHATACDSYNWNGETYTESGDYVHYTTMATGCTLVTILHLTIYDTEISEFSVTTADSCYIWNDITYCNSGDYVQLLQTSAGCDSIVTLHLTITVGIDDHEEVGSLMLYPNPTDNIVNVRFSLNGRPVTSDAEIRIFDMYGKFLHAVPVTGETTALDLSSYASGVYMVKAVMDGQVVAVRKAVRR